MRVAAYQAPLQATRSMEALSLIREQIDWCESEGVEILCCPEGVLGGLADYVSRPRRHPGCARWEQGKWHRPTPAKARRQTAAVKPGIRTAPGDHSRLAKRDLETAEIARG
jgi:hypothetical protein